MSDSLNFLATVAKRIEREQAAARPIVADLRGTIDKMWDRDVPPSWQTVGFARELTSAASESLDQDARKSQTLAQYAIVIVTSIPPGSYPTSILLAQEAEAWKELANAHRYLSEYDAALRALDSADRLLQHASSLDWERAIIRFARALVLCDKGEFDEARPLAAESIASFRQYRDLRRTGHGLLLKGMIEQRSGEFHTAGETFRRAVEVLDRTDDLIGLASAHNNFGFSQAELGETSVAVAALHKSLAIFDELGLQNEGARTRCILAAVLLRAGRYHQARDLFASGRETFRRFGMVEETGIAGLDLADALPALGDVKQARTVVEEVFCDFREAGLNERAMVALAYLRDSVPTKRARQVVSHVKSYLKQLNEHPLRLFAPLPDE